MRCDAVDPELVAYHFGALSPETRDAVEAHLSECLACVRVYVALKRDLETAEHASPSPVTRERIRGSVAKALRASTRDGGGRRWERRLAFGVASAAVVAAMTFAHLVWTTPGAAPYGLERQGGHPPDGR